MKEQIAKIFSYIFHPLFLPVYAVIILFYLPSYLSHYQFVYKKGIVLVVFMSTFVSPLLVMLILLNLRVISDLQLSKREERFLPLAIIGAIYIASYFIMLRLPVGVPSDISNFLLVSSIVIFIVLLFNFRTKISIHSAGTGGFISYFLIFFNKENMSETLFSVIIFNFTAIHFFTLLILIIGIIMTSRLILKSHNLKQIAIGFLVGFFVGILSIFIN